jgi:hemolysin activation/secretion protein
MHSRWIRGVLSAVLVSIWSTCTIAQQADAPEAGPRFTVSTYLVEGNTLIPNAEVDARIRPYTGERRSFQDIQRAAQALASAYQERGFEAVRVVIPEQDIRMGVVRLRVIEARIHDIRIEGNHHYDDDNIRASLPALREGEPPNIRRIGANVSLANENPIRKEHVSFENAGQPGMIDAVVRVEDDSPVRFGAFLDNSGNPASGGYRAGLGFMHANLWGADHVLNLQLLTSPTEHRGVLIFGAGYRAPLYGHDALIDVYGGRSDLNSGTLENLFNVSGSGTIAGARYTQVMPRLGAYEHKSAIGLEWKAFDNRVVLVGTSVSLVPDVTTVPLTLSYSGRYEVPGKEAGFYASFASNLPYGDGDASPAAIAAARAGAAAHFHILRTGASFSLAVLEDDILRLVFDAQYTSDALVPGEQYGIGGQNSVRGFYERELAFDVGHRLSLEIYGPDFGSRLGADWHARLLGFWDLGRGYDQDPARLPAEGISSVGFGGRFNQGNHLSARFDAALIVNGTPLHPDGDLRLLFGVAYNF